MFYYILYRNSGRSGPLRCSCLTKNCYWKPVSTSTTGRAVWCVLISLQIINLISFKTCSKSSIIFFSSWHDVAIHCHEPLWAAYSPGTAWSELNSSHRCPLMSTRQKSEQLCIRLLTPQSDVLGAELVLNRCFTPTLYPFTQPLLLLLTWLVRQTACLWEEQRHLTPLKRRISFSF